MSNFAIVLAAGKGTRMKSELPKVLSELNGKPLILHVLERAERAGINQLVVVVGYKREMVEARVKEWAMSRPYLKIQFAIQEEQHGTGHAVMMADGLVPQDDSMVTILLGDVPFVEPSTLQKAMVDLEQGQAVATVISMKLDDPTGYGRIVRDTEENILEIREEKDANEEIRKIDEVNSGIFIFKSRNLWQALSKIDNKNAQGEYYITDTIHVLREDGKSVKAYLSANADQFRGINSKEQLEQMGNLQQ